MPGLLNHVFKSEASFIKRSFGEIDSAFSIRHGVYVRGQGPLTKGGGIRVSPQKMFPCIFVLFKLPVLYNIHRVPQKCLLAFLSLNRFRKSVFTFLRVFWNQKRKPVSTSHFNNTITDGGSTAPLYC